MTDDEYIEALQGAAASANADYQAQIISAQNNQLQNMAFTTTYNSMYRINPTDILNAQWQGNPWGWRNEEPSPAEKEIAMAEMKTLSSEAQKITVKEEGGATAHVTLLKELGFVNLHKAVEHVAERAMRENLISLAGYTKITEAAFEKAKDRISQASKGSLRLALTRVESYLGQHNDGDSTEVTMPPTAVLQEMSKAKKAGLFDSFSIIHVCKVQDPILVGQINGSNDLYFIAEWGDDISLQELV